MLGDSIELLDADALQVVGLLWQPSLSGIRELFNGDRENKLGHEAYCDYFRRQWHILALYGDEQHAGSSSPQAITRLMAHIQNGQTREELMHPLQEAGVEEEACERSLNLAVRLLVMMRFGIAKHQVSPRRFLRWEQGTLQAFIHVLFEEVPKLSCEQVRLPKSFDAWSIANIAGIEIAFTDNIADHLLLVDDDTRLLIFHHASFLEYHRSKTSLFPGDLVNETLRTLALLFPQAEFSNQRRTRTPRRRWLQSLRVKHRETEHTVIDPRLALCGTPQGEDRQIERFRFWRDRLVILKQAYDDATPQTLGQWWHDRRNGVQWYTFWVAVLVLVITTFLSVVQAIEGALQVYKAYRPTE
ncbi:uncharacterized protein B0H64DRAFT_410347 [Chaetomium fimeti]|uniref:Uncharacterized protein n=1 Tax=Chaetomium fimeti TaxID=1854472 RepID=A0AAE0LNN5_9PEZI|nr:hypothetical protein B0H64DRAFT_410347 [Chaetomium fimeti]